MATAHLFHGGLDTARSLLRDSAVIAGQIGNDDLLAAALGNLGAELAAGCALTQRQAIALLPSLKPAHDTLQ